MSGRKNIKGVVWHMLLWVEGGTIPDDSVVAEMPQPADTDSTTGKYLRKLMRKLECDHGGKKNCLEPFEILSHQEVKKELTTRKLNSMGDSKVVRQRLAEHLGGLQHVPLLLVSNPQEDIKALHLDHYSLNDFEPLRVLKGHLINMFAEIPFLLSSTLKQEVDQVLASSPGHLQ